MSICPESVERSRMSDGEFWDHVLQGASPDDADPEPDPQVRLGTCPECGEVGACSWDTYGRPMIHATAEES